MPRAPSQHSQSASAYNDTRLSQLRCTGCWFLMLIDSLSFTPSPELLNSNLYNAVIAAVKRKLPVDLWKYLIFTKLVALPLQRFAATTNLKNLGMNPTHPTQNCCSWRSRASHRTRHSNIERVRSLFLSYHTIPLSLFSHVYICCRIV